MNVNRWCLDSECTSHMCGSSEKFDEKPQRRLNLANHTSASIEGAGSLSTAFRNGNNARATSLKDTLYVPELRTNLLSVSRITDNGYNVTFYCEKAVIRDNKNKSILNERTDYILFRKSQR